MLQDRSAIIRESTFFIRPGSQSCIRPMEAAERMYAWLLGRLVLLIDHDANTWQLCFGVTALLALSELILAAI